MWISLAPDYDAITAKVAYQDALPFMSTDAHMMGIKITHNRKRKQTGINTQQEKKRNSHGMARQARRQQQGIQPKPNLPNLRHGLHATRREICYKQ